MMKIMEVEKGYDNYDGRRYDVKVVVVVAVYNNIKSNYNEFSLQFEKNCHSLV
jgi:hypothetical protein